jgi:RNA polymerase sigma-70 factor, ECF subfamily
MGDSSAIVPDAKPQVTELLLAWRDGESSALDELMPIVYSELKRIAAGLMRRQNPADTLQTTALVNEAYLRLIDSDKVNWQNRTHFFALSAQLMRRILVDAARKRGSEKRGGGRVQVTFDEQLNVPSDTVSDLVELDEALTRLAQLNPRHSQIVELRFFAGLTEEQVAVILNVSSRTVRRDWNLARAWLFRELRPIRTL